MRKLFMVCIAVLLALSFGLGQASHVMAQAKVVRLTLIDENGSGEDGSAQITDQGDGTTKVELIMTNEPAGAEQPAAIHAGTCTSLDADVAFALTAVKDLKSTSTIKTALAPLLDSKYAVVVRKSATDNTVISCGILPSAAVANGGQLTLDQIMTTLVDQATELQGSIKNKEADGSQNAFKAFHATFAAHEAEIKAKSAPDQAEIDAAMGGVEQALNAGNWDDAATAAAELVTKVKEGQDALAGSSSSSPASGGSLADVMSSLETKANDLVRETGNKDTAGANAAYTDFHDSFAANEADIMAKNASAQSNIEGVMHEVRDAIAAGDWAKASTASTELVNTVKESAAMVSGTSSGSTLPTTGAGNVGDTGLMALVVLALGLVCAGVVVRRKALC